MIQMSAPAPAPAVDLKKAIEAINACVGLTVDEKAAARAFAVRDLNVAPGIVATPPEELADTIRHLIAPPSVLAAPPSIGESHPHLPMHTCTPHVYTHCIYAHTKVIMA